ncbi:PKD domain-containing protein [Aurantivibrio infirmus]
MRNGTRRNNLVFPTLIASLVFVTACRDDGGIPGGSGGGSGSNTPPTADAGADQSVNETTTVNLTGVGSDQEGAVTYQWVQDSGPSVTINNSTSAAASFTAPDVNADSLITLRLTVFDTDGASASDTVDITVLDQSPPPNTPPTVNAGADQSVIEMSNVTLSGSGTDAESTVSYQWSQTTGPTVIISNPTSASASFTAPNVSADTTLTFQLSVTDAGGLVATDSLDITVSDQVTTPGTSFTHRVKTMRYDYDNNGIFEGVAVHDYNPDGTLNSITYTYTDDGVADTDFISFKLGPFIEITESETQSFSYDANNLLEFWDINSTNKSSRVSYTWNGESAFNSVLLETFNMGNQESALEFIGSYSGGLLDTASGTVNFPVMPNPLTQEIELNYDAQGVLQSDLWTVAQGGTIATQLQRDFTWDANGAIDLTVSTDPRPGATYQDSRDYEYVNNQIARIESILPSNHYFWHENFDTNNLFVNRQIDLNVDGSIEGQINIEWEAGSCQEVVFWLPRTTPDTRKRTANPSPLISLGDGHGVFLTCGTATP